MLNDYIKNIQTENDMKLSSLQSEMQDLVNDLNCTEKVVEKLQHEKKLDTNIFSPRTIDVRADEKIEEAQNKINEIKNRMEYVSKMIEEAVKQKNELLLLKEEADNFASEKSKRYDDFAVNSEDKLNDSSSEELKKFLNTIYKKTETSLALVNGNKNHCKAELRSTLSLIREYAKKLENEADI